MASNHRGIDRREFLKLTAAGSGLAILGCRFLAIWGRTRWRARRLPVSVPTTRRMA
jgi:hypothetical protein